MQNLIDITSVIVKIEMFRNNKLDDLEELKKHQKLERLPSQEDLAKTNRPMVPDHQIYTKLGKIMFFLIYKGEDGKSLSIKNYMIIILVLNLFENFELVSKEQNSQDAGAEGQLSSFIFNKTKEYHESKEKQEKMTLKDYLKLKTHDLTYYKKIREMITHKWAPKIIMLHHVFILSNSLNNVLHYILDIFQCKHTTPEDNNRSFVKRVKDIFGLEKNHELKIQEAISKFRVNEKDYYIDHLNKIIIRRTHIPRNIINEKLISRFDNIERVYKKVINIFNKINDSEVTLDESIKIDDVVFEKMLNYDDILDFETTI